MKKNDIVELHITDMTSGGAGIGKADGFPFFINGTVPGDVIRAKVMKVKKTYGYARLVEILTPSQDRVTPPCKEASRCGGCQLQHLSYEAQLRFKEKKVRDALERIGGVSLAEPVPESVTEPVEVPGDKGTVLLPPSDRGSGTLSGLAGDTVCQTEGPDSVPDPLSDIVPLSPILPSPRPLRYRNKMQVPFGKDKEGKMVYGFYARRTHAIIPCVDCLIGFEEARGILDHIRNYCDTHGIPAYDERTGEGMLRHVLLRKAEAIGQVQVCLIVNAEPSSHVAAELVEVPDPLSDIASLTINFNPARTNVILGRTTQTLFGNPYIEDELLGLTFRIAPQSFYQVNHAMTELLYEQVAALALSFNREDGAHITPNAEHSGDSAEDCPDTQLIIWDLYCGIGTISLMLAKRLQEGRVYGIEVVPEAIANARDNARLNGITNATFACGKAENLRREPGTDRFRLHPSNETETASDESVEFPRPDVIVVDPPRKGCDRALLDTILAAAPERIVYVSCDPATLARDLKILCADGTYRLTYVQPFDMFSQTVHVETIVLLQRQNA